MCAAQSNDIRKMGHLKKLKTMKRKLFFLREESETGPARLEYYDSDKKYRAGLPPKRSINLKACFNINRKSDSRHKYAIALYTNDDCFSVMCDSEEERGEWLTAMLELQKDNEDEDEEPRRNFEQDIVCLDSEHIWQVTVKARGLGNGKTLQSGSYRLCLTNKTLSLIRPTRQDQDIVFQLASIRRCGHSDCFFFMEVGRSAVTGAGEMWMQVEDTVIAQNMHEAILGSMKSMNTAGDQPNFRPRSRSSVSDKSTTKPISVPSSSRGASPGYESATLPKRSKTISGEHPGSPTGSRLRPGSKTSSMRSSTTSGLGRGHSPVTNSPLSHMLSEAHRSRTDSMESHGSRGTISSLSADELDLSPHDHHSSTASTRSVTPEGPTREDYLAMTPTATKDITVSPSSDGSHQRDEYMAMSPSTSGGRDTGYMDMSPGTPLGESSYLDMGRTSFSSSPAVSTTSSGHDTDDHGYLDMVPIAHSLPTVQEKITDGGYLEMSPGTVWANKANLSKPERVQSYLSDDQALEDFPKRAYSVGSKPATIKNRNNYAYVDMSGKHGLLDKVNPKSSSAPHLVDKEKNQGIDSSKVKDQKGKDRSSTSDLFMELDFMTPKRESESSPFRPRTASAGKEVKSHISSVGQEIRRRTGSFGMDGINRTASIGRHDRPRTATICQDSFRTRTSSCGSSDMRPRSSSYGNRTHRKSKSTEKGSEGNSRSSSRHSSQESLRRAIQKASQESLSKAMQDCHVDRSGRQGSSPSSMMTSGAMGRSLDRSSVGTVYRSSPQYSREEEYLDMTPGESVPAAGRSYVEMNIDREPSKERDWLQRKRSSEHGHKSSEHKTSKNKHRSSSRPHHHGLFLRMPVADTNKSSSDSLSSSGQSSDARNRDEASTDGADRSPGEYIDLEFNQKSLPLTPGKETSGLKEENPKVEWTVPTREPRGGDTYLVYKPGPSLKSPASPAGLEQVPCPLRLDDSDNLLSKHTLDMKRNASKPPPADTSPVSRQTVTQPPIGDPFALLSPSEKSPHVSLHRGEKHSRMEASKEVSRDDQGSKVGSSRSSKQRRSPKLPPKVKSKSKLYTAVGEGEQLSKAVSVSVSEGKQKVVVSPSVSTVVETGGSVSPQTSIAYSATVQGTLDPSSSSSTLKIPPPKSLGAQSVQRVGSTSSLSSIESSMSHASAKVSIPSRGSASNLTTMDVCGQPPASVTTRVSNAPRLRVLSGEASAETVSVVGVAEGTSCDAATLYSSQTSVGSEKELNYASLDLASSMEEGSFPCLSDRGPRSPLIGKNTHSTVSEEQPAPLAYAEIDFAKSESLRNAPSSSVREKPPFDVN